jgi:hypothetical protein
MVVNTLDYMVKVLALLDDPAYKKLAKDPTQPAECKITLLIKGSSLPEDVAK